jgi:hypothetical protein
LIPEAAIRPFTFAVVTTMVGFGATAVSTVPVVRHFGLLGVFGIGVCAIMTVAITFPVLARKRAERSRRDPQILPSVLEYPLRISRRNTLLLVGVLSVIIVGGLPRVRVDYGPLDYLTLDNQVRSDMDRGGESRTRIAARRAPSRVRRARACRARAQQRRPACLPRRTVDNQRHVLAMVSGIRHLSVLLLRFDAVLRGILVAGFRRRRDVPYRGVSAASAEALVCCQTWASPW